MEERNSAGSDLFTILQLSDSAFPTGGFSHSLGFEAACQTSYVKNKGELKTFVLGCLENAGSLNLPYLRCSHQAFQGHEELCALDHMYNACVSNHVANRASVQQGRSLLTSCCEAFGLKFMRELEDLVDEEKLHGHQVVIFGVVCAVLGISLRKTYEMYLFSALRTVTASIVRLGKIGALEAQHLQFEMQKCLPNIISRNQDRSISDAAITFPLLEVFQNSHDSLFMKLFIS